VVLRVQVMRARVPCTASTIEGHTLGREDAAGRSDHVGNHVTRRDAAAVGPFYGCRRRGIDQPKGEHRQIEPCDQPRLTRDQGGVGPRLSRHDRVGGDIAGAAKILDQRCTNQRLDYQG
jgi:hypothetical protein